MRIGIILCSMACIVSAGDQLCKERAVLSDLNQEGAAALVTAKGQAFALSLFDHEGILRWSHRLDQQPARIHLLPGERVLIEERGELLTPTHDRNRVQIIGREGSQWRAPGAGYYCELAPDRSRFLVKSLGEKGNVLSVYDLQGSLLQEFDLILDDAVDARPLFDERMARFSADGAAVLITPTDAGGIGLTELHPLDGSNPFMLNLKGVQIATAVAPNAQEVLLLGTDQVIRKLRQNEIVFEIKPENGAYYSLELSPDRQMFLSSRGLGFDLFRIDGTRVTSFDPKENSENLARVFHLPTGKTKTEITQFFGHFQPSFNEQGLVLSHFNKQVFYEANFNELLSSWRVARQTGDPLLDLNYSGTWRLVYRNGFTQREQIKYLSM